MKTWKFQNNGDSDHSGNDSYSSDSDGEVAVQEDDGGLSEPPQYRVLLHNDDYTTMEFVIEILRRYFHKSHDQAMQVMLNVHEKGKGVAGVYSQEIAETKVVQVMERARAKGFPLMCTAEAIDD